MRISKGLRVAIALGVLIAAWVVAAWVIAPIVLGAIYRGALPGADAFMGGRSGTPLSSYLATWAVVRASATFVMVTTGLLVGGALLVIRRPVDGSEISSPETADGAAIGLRAAMLVGAFFGLWGGLGESYYLGAKWLVLGEPVHSFRRFSQHNLWMTPIVTAVLYALVGALLVIVARARRRPVSARAIVATPMFLALFSWALWPDRLAGWAAALICAGLAVRGSAHVTAHPARFVRLARGGTRLGLVVLTALIVSVPLTLRVQEAARMREAGPVREKHDNLLLITLDTQRAASTGMYRTGLETTPNLERFADRGVTFDRAMATSSWTLPSHASLFTGRYNFELKTGDARPLDDRFETLAESLSKRGYATGAFVANLGFLNDLYGVGRGFQHYDDQPLSFRMALAGPVLLRSLVRDVAPLIGVNLQDVRKRAPAVNRGFLDWIDERGDRPFFAFLNYFDAHAPFDPPSEFGRSTAFAPFARGPFTRASTSQAISADEMTELETQYHRAIQYLDDHVGVLLDELDDRGLLGSTYVVITSDHGEAFGEHGFFAHKRTLFAEEIQVPLVVLSPSGVGAGSRIRTPVSLRDFPATALELLGWDNPFPGRSWFSADAAPVLSELDEYPSGDALQLNAPNWWSITSGPLHYIRQPSGAESLFELDTDPWEQADLSQDSAHLDTLRWFRRVLDELVPDDGRARSGGRALSWVPDPPVSEPRQRSRPPSRWPP
ncbi:MAG: sulfatase [Gemmatimonadota bacterium]